MTDTAFVTDTLGRSLEIKILTSADQFDLLEAAQDRAEYRHWFGLAALVFSCVGIDGVPLPMPRKPADFKKSALALKDEGIKALSEYFANQTEADKNKVITDVESAKN